jgi:ADP-heptose:LPS heptosyltransferase
MRSQDAVALDRNLPYIYLQHEVLRYLEVVGLVGAKPVTLEPVLAVTPADVAAAAAVAPCADRPLAVIHAGASDPRRHWPAWLFAAVADALIERGADVALVADASEARVSAQVVKAMTHRALDLSGRLTLAALVGLLARCAVFVGNDSGPLHLARTVGAATVGVYWCANMVNAAPMSRQRHRALASWRVNCPICGVDSIKGSCRHTASLVADVPLQDVREEALDLLHAEMSQMAHGASTCRSTTVVGSS